MITAWFIFLCISFCERCFSFLIPFSEEIIIYFLICHPPNPWPLEIIIPHAWEEAMVLFQRLFSWELKQ